ncbi:MAG TPA: hypothetical protein VMY38_05175 [Gemmatimonadaceae bacterium]|nr:hypothetical protein [Gemmatimonadaceae bacterium]
MFVELIDLLRCTRPHEDSWLVATFHELRERHVLEGLLSCPVCGARYEIRGGVALFGGDFAQAGAVAGADEDGVRFAAFLNLVEPGIVVLGGAWAGAADTITRLGSAVIALNAARGAGLPRLSRIRSDGSVPLARECVDGIALDSADMAMLESAARALKNGGRMVAPADAGIPGGMRELARDEQVWIAVKEGLTASAPVQIARR